MVISQVSQIEDVKNPRTLAEFCNIWDLENGFSTSAIMELQSKKLTNALPKDVAFFKGTTSDEGKDNEEVRNSEDS